MDPFVQIKIASVVLAVPVVAATSYRIYIRRWRIWWDDGFAFLGMLAFLVQIAAVFMHIHRPNSLSWLSRVASYYMISTSFYLMIWSARLSIIFSVVRIDPSGYRRRKLYIFIVLFFLALILLFVQLFIVCEHQPGWKDAHNPQCTLTRLIAISQLTTDVVADSILLWSPLKILSGLDDKVLRRRLMIIFSTCIATTIVSLVHAVFILEDEGVKVILVAIVENGVSLLVCNVPVVVTATLHLRGTSPAESTDDGRPSTFIRFASLRLRTTDTDASSSSQSQSQDRGPVFTEITLPTTTYSEAATRQDGKYSEDASAPGRTEVPRPREGSSAKAARDRTGSAVA
ncbi:hypothetical protein PLICRDRAFT_94109 [Plicaturopsis crispa FD-325 SS-3]|nr:hypothetical protein PLICRDRAFT_94109 [Plicaturopsis crispa FD-325 SS-3]